MGKQRSSTIFDSDEIKYLAISTTKGLLPKNTVPLQKSEKRWK